MPTLFSKIIQGEIPGRFVWKDERAVAFLTIRPIQAGHTLVVPRLEVDHWLDLPADLTSHLFGVAQHVGRGIQHAFQPTRVGMMIAGLEVPHTHLHLVPVWKIADLDFAAQKDVAPAELDLAAEKLRASLKALGYSQVSS
jgi:histidine triad (HIT) family protein